jgi:hypothetical protein
MPIPPKLKNNEKAEFHPQKVEALAELKHERASIVAFVTACKARGLKQRIKARRSVLSWF